MQTGRGKLRKPSKKVQTDAIGVELRNEALVGGKFDERSADRQKQVIFRHKKAGFLLDKQGVNADRQTDRQTEDRMIQPTPPSREVFIPCAGIRPPTPIFSIPYACMSIPTTFLDVTGGEKSRKR